MVRNSWFLGLIVIAVACIGAPETPTAREGSREASKRNLDSVLKHLEPVISSSDKAVRLYYCADCHAAKDFGLDDPVAFPSVNVQPPPKGAAGLSAVREIFRNDKNVTVTEEPVGIIRIWIGKVPTAILQTKLSRITLEPMDQYNPNDAIEVIMGAKEMEVAMRSLGVDSVVRGGGLVAEPDKDLAQLPPSIGNVTVEQVLDMIAKTWVRQGFVMYGACADQSGLPSGGRPFWLEYVGGIAPVQKNTKKQ